MPKLKYVTKITHRDGTNIVERNKRVLELHRAGLTNGVISKRLQITAPAVYAILRKMKRK